MTTTAVKKLVKKCEFSRICGTSATATTKACKTHLKPALVGNRIDIYHPASIKYMEKHAATPTPEPATGIDPLYEQALKHCQDSGNFSASSIQKNMNIGYARAKKIFALIEAVGGKDAPTPPPVPGPPITGRAAANKSKKSADLAELHNRIENGTKLHEIPDDIKAFADMTLRELIQRFGTETAFKDWLAATKSIEDINEKRIKNAVSRGELVNKQLIKIGVIDPINTAHQHLLTDGAKTITRRVIAMSGAGRSVDECEKFVVDQISSHIKPMKTKMKRNYNNV